MNNNLKFIWFDDYPQRKKTANNMAEKLSIKVDFISLQGKKVDDVLKEVLQGEEPDLILMDHSLYKAEVETVNKGSTAAAVLREKWHHCPIVSVTEVEKVDMDLFQRAAYDAIFEFRNISKNYSTILSIAHGFKTLKTYYPKNISEIFDLMEVPVDDREKMKKILPIEIKDNLQDKSLLIEIYRWYSSTLHKRPGFLYDRTWVSTLLGLSNSGFKQVEEKFDQAKYKGVFKDDSNERWWKSEVLSILGNEVDEVGLPWIIGRSLVENQKKYFSKCHASGEEFPETVAAEDETADSDWYPMKLKHTEPHPFFEDMLFFEELRIMKPAE